MSTNEKGIPVVGKAKIWSNCKLIEEITAYQDALQITPFNRENSGEIQSKEVILQKHYREETEKIAHKLREIEGKARRGNKDKAPQTREEAIKEAADELENLSQDLLEKAEKPRERAKELFEEEVETA